MRIILKNTLIFPFAVLSGRKKVCTKSSAADIEALAAGCHFRDCTHQREPSCAVRAALERGELSKARILSYLKLKTENAWSEDAESYLAEKEKKFKRYPDSTR